MSTPNPDPNVLHTPNAEQDPFIPPSWILGLAGIGLLVSLVVLLTQAQFGVIGWGGLALAGLSLVVWVFMSPAQAKAIVTGRTARYGGTTVLVTVLFIAALSAVYTFVKGANIRLDLTQTDTFSLNDQSRQSIAGLAVEPNVPGIKILAFYGQGQSSRRDQDSVLFDDYATTSQNKITYEFVDPDRNPTLAQLYKVTRSGQIVVAPLDAEGNPVADKAQLVNLFNQEDLSNAILRVAASGDFRAYFLNVDGALKIDDTGATGLSGLNGNLKDSFNWKTESVNFLDLTKPNSEINLNDALADGQVLIIPGGASVLPDEQVKFITDYLDKGGRVAIFAAPLSADGKPTLSQTESLNTYLYEKFGIRYNSDILLDQTNAFQTVFAPLAVTFDTNHFITSPLATTRGSAMVFETPHSIEVAPSLPQNVTVTELAKTADTTYSRSDASVLTATDPAQIAQTDADPKGPFVVAAAAENVETGARVVLFGSLYTGTNQFENLRSLNVLNSDVALRSVAWLTTFDEFFNQIPQLGATARPQDTPVFMSEQMGRNINLITVIVLPFGALLLGIWVWWNSREKAA
jgi:ABC-type uncharacterized transport system involved in gliding motility auxiliary subunit